MKQNSLIYGALPERLEFRSSFFSLALLALLFFSALPTFAADDSLSQKTSQTIEETKKAVQDAGQATMDDVWRRLDEARLKNRSPDEIIAWALMGILVGAVAGVLTSLKSPGKVGYLVSGLVGAFIGGILVNLTKVNFGWGPVLIRYEELLFSLAGAILIVALLKLTGLKKFR